MIWQAGMGWAEWTVDASDGSTTTTTTTTTKTPSTLVSFPQHSHMHQRVVAAETLDPVICQYNSARLR